MDPGLDPGPGINAACRQARVTRGAPTLLLLLAVDRQVRPFAAPLPIKIRRQCQGR